MTDTEIMYESFLEDVNSIINTGEITNLYQKEDFDRMIESVGEVLDSRHLSANRDSAYTVFISRVRDNFHVVLCFSPVGDSLRNRCR
jgi:dynein heavy chain